MTYTPGSGRSSCTNSTFAVGNPSFRPRAAPGITLPDTAYGRQSSSSASRTRPDSRSSRIRLELTIAPPRRSGGTTSTSNPSSRPIRRSIPGEPVRFLPKVKSYPTVTKRARSRSWTTVRANSSGPIPPIAPVNGSTTMRSIPSFSILDAFSPNEVSS